MNAVWRSTRAMIGRRRLPTTVVAVVVGLSTVALVVALGLLSQSTNGFMKAFTAHRGAHLTAEFDRTLVSPADLGRTLPGLTGQAGPFPQVDLTLVAHGLPLDGTRIVGRATAAGPVDDIDVQNGRWPRAMGEAVVNVDVQPTAIRLGDTVTATGLPGSPTLTVVGLAASMTDTAAVWVTPDQATAFSQPGVAAGWQVLYRFTHSDTDTQMATNLAAVNAGLPAGALLADSTYLAQAHAADDANPAIPFLVAFAVLGIIVAAVIVADVVTGAVLAGRRTIGVLKSIGFTPRQVTGVYLLVVAVPATIGAAMGTAAGLLLSVPVLRQSAQAQGLPIAPARAGWLVAAGLFGLPAIAALAAWGPALRAASLSPVEAISTGRTPIAGSSRVAARLGARLRLPRPAALGLASTAARPGRALTALTVILLGAAAIIFTTGLTISLRRAAVDIGRPQVQIGIERSTDPSGKSISDDDTVRTIWAQPGTLHVAAEADYPTAMSLAQQTVDVIAIRDGGDWLGYPIVTGHWPSQAGEALVAKPFLDATHAVVGDTVTVGVHGHPVPLHIVGEMFGGTDNPIYTDWSTITPFLPGAQATRYEVQLTAGTDPTAYAQDLYAHPQLNVRVNESARNQTIVVIWTPLAVLLSLLLAGVAALGVFHNVVLTTRERAHDLAVLKAIGMTPRQTITMMVASVVGAGLVGGVLAIPLAVSLHHLVIPAMARAAQTVLPTSLVHVYSPELLIGLAASGVAIAVAGALLPAIIVARMRTAANLRAE